MADHTVTDLLARLATPAAGAAWAEFLARYAPAMRSVVRRYELDPGRAEDCFEYACASLTDDGFRRLRQFQADGPARFATWLRAVVARLCVDWRRREQGRQRPPRSILRLPDLERHVYHCLYERGMSRHECLECLGPRFPGLTLDCVAAINARLFRTLTPRQRWQLGVRRGTASLDREDGRAADGSPVALEPDPGTIVTDDEDLRRVRQALARLPPDERLLLRLRYEQELTLSEVARLTAQPDPFRAHRRIQAALAHLVESMDQECCDGARKD
jgi:RNA polymerase sigma factor (sigma-70 family)